MEHIKFGCLLVFYGMAFSTLFTDFSKGNFYMALLIGCLMLVVGAIYRKQGNIMGIAYFIISGVVFLMALAMVYFPDSPMWG